MAKLELNVDELLKKANKKYYYFKAGHTNPQYEKSGRLILFDDKNIYEDAIRVDEQIIGTQFDIENCRIIDLYNTPAYNFVSPNSDIKYYKYADTNCEKLIGNLKKTGEYDKAQWDNIYSIISKVFVDCDFTPPEPPTPEGGGESGETDKTCSNTGQFGGGGTPLKDIKLFLYANNVTKGTIKLSKPQVEVGTFATDWRPNPSDYVERNSPAYKEVKGLAIQHNQDQNKKYIEVQATDGTVYGVDIWGGDAKKQLEQQKAEIEELKKLVQTLETKINV